jgi:hypothetical protein
MAFCHCVACHLSYFKSYDFSFSPVTAWYVFREFPVCHIKKTSNTSYAIGVSMTGGTYCINDIWVKMAYIHVVLI